MNAEYLDSPSGSDYDEVPSASEGGFAARRQHRQTKSTRPAKKRRPDEDDDEFIDLSTIRLRPDHRSRPVWIVIGKDTRKIIIESFHPLAQNAQQFAISVAEPVSRPSFLHEYSITEQSLLSAQSVGNDADTVIRTCDQLSKTEIPDSFKAWIRETTKSFGKIKLVLMHNCYYVQSPDRQALRSVLSDPVIASLKIEGTEENLKEKKQAELMIQGTTNTSKNQQLAQQQAQQEENVRRDDRDEESDEDEIADEDMIAALRREEEGEDDDEDEGEDIHRFEILQESVEKVKQRCLEIRLPILEEYDFRADTVNYKLDIDLRPGVSTRSYQETALQKMFGNGRARSGIIVLPCGAGKTLVGIAAACTIKKGVIILCTSAMSVKQWRNEFLKWTNINPDHIAMFTADDKEWFKDKTAGTGVIISTYSMIAERARRAHDTETFLQNIRGREWGLMLLDETHVVPADMFRKVSGSIKCHSKLGLTATLLREDDKISDLNYLIGPKLYEANWMELSEQGHIARVQCAEVWCPMTAEFFAEYLQHKSKQRSLFATMNPGKFQACQFLIEYHEKRGDKNIVFSDNVFTLQQYAKMLMKPFIDGSTNNAERQKVLENFQNNPMINTIFLSKVGDTSLDLPEATCLIQISSHYASRRQEAQRLGRILRAKRRNDEGFNAFFYSLVSKDTDEMTYSTRRQSFLVDQGYAFKTITQLRGMESLPGLKLNTTHEQREWLQNVLMNVENAGQERVDDENLWDRSGGKGGARKGTMVRRTAGMLGELSGGGDMAYMEYGRGNKNKELKKQQQGKGNAFFRKVKRDRERARDAAQRMMEG